MMKKNAVLVLLTLLTQTASAQTADSLYMALYYTKREVMVPMRDDVKLFTAVYAPKDDAEKHPILLVRTPYSAGPYGATRFSPRIYATHWFNYVKEKYIIVMQDVRGRYMSEGDFVDVRPFIENKKGKKDIDEASDTYDTIDWLVKNTPNNNGNVGVFGISYPGFYSTMAALSGHPALKAVSPQAPVTDWFIGDDFHHNGALALMDAFGFYTGFGKPRPKPGPKSAKGFDFPEKDAYSFYLKQGALKNYGKYTDSVAFWKDLMSHPDYDDWWKARDARRACKNIKPAVLVVGGTFDAEDCFGAWNLYKAIERQSPKTSSNLVMGPWYHGGWSRSDGSSLGNIRFGAKTSAYYQNNFELPFFNYYLKGKGSVNFPEATVFFSGENAWRSFESWPPAKVNYKNLYFAPNKKLSFDLPTETASFSGYTSDPAKPVPYSESINMGHTREYMNDDQRFASRRPDVLVFETEPLSSDLSLAGPVVANLKVQLNAADADFVVKIIDVFPDNFIYDTSYCCKNARLEAEMAGYQMLVRGEIMRGRYRKSFEKPEPFNKDSIETVRFEMPDVAHTFRKGHKLMVQVQSTWFPLFDRNPQRFVNIYQCDDKDFVPAVINLFHQQNQASGLILPVLENK